MIDDLLRALRENEMSPGFPIHLSEPPARLRLELIPRRVRAQATDGEMHVGLPRHVSEIGGTH